MMTMMEKLANHSLILIGQSIKVHTTCTYPLVGLLSDDAGNCFIMGRYDGGVQC
jgi:hypothetical protein